VTASVITHGAGEGHGQIHPFATLNWTTYVTSGFGSQHEAGANVGNAVAVDSSGNIYVTGYTDDSSPQNPSDRMGFVAEYTNAGGQPNRVAFTDFEAQDPSLGLYTQTQGNAIAVDNNGGVYVVGTAMYPVGGDTDAFLMKFELDSNNQLMPVAGYGGSIGSSFNDSGQGVVVDAQGEATITGKFSPTATETDVFAAKFNADGTDTFFTNYYQIMDANGNTLTSAGNAIALNNPGSNAYLAGNVQDSNANMDILVMEIDNTTSGNQVYMFPTTGNPIPGTLNGIGIDQGGAAYVSGTLTVSGVVDAVAQVSADGSTLLASAALPNAPTANGLSLSVDSSSGNVANVYVVGSSPVSVLKFDTTLAPGDSTTLSGNGMDTASGVAYDPTSGNVYVIGTTTSSNLSTDGTVLKGSSDAFLSNVGSFS